MVEIRRYRKFRVTVERLRFVRAIMYTSSTSESHRHQSNRERRRGRKVEDRSAKSANRTFFVATSRAGSGELTPRRKKVCQHELGVPNGSSPYHFSTNCKLPVGIDRWVRQGLRIV